VEQQEAGEESSSIQQVPNEQEKEQDNDDEVRGDTTTTSTIIRAPLKFVGPYPCLGVRFPNLATVAQKARNESGVTLDFVLDTAANTNTINAAVAQALNLTVIGQAPPGMGSAGPIQGDDLPTFFLGDMQLEGLGNEIFLQNLTASALPIASPATAGLLSLTFFQSVGDAGVTFDWHGGEDGETKVPPSITFTTNDHHEDGDVTTHNVHTNERNNGLQCVKITRLPVTQLPSIQVTINGHTFPALLDTGSPITVLNAQAAQLCGITTSTTIDGTTTDDPKKKKNPFRVLQERFQQAQTASRGQVLTIFGANGNRVNLVQSNESVQVTIPTTSNVNNDEKEEKEEAAVVVDFGKTHVYVGDLPGLAALQGLGEDAPPAIVLGMDVLRRKRYMLFRPIANQVWF
jgi:hypothetical protein